MKKMFAYNPKSIPVDVNDFPPIDKLGGRGKR